MIGLRRFPELPNGVVAEYNWDFKYSASARDIAVMNPAMAITQNAIINSVMPRRNLDMRPLQHRVGVGGFRATIIVSGSVLLHNVIQMTVMRPVFSAFTNVQFGT